MAVNLPRRRTVKTAARRFDLSCQLQNAVEGESHCLKRGRVEPQRKLGENFACRMSAFGTKRTLVGDVAMSAFDPKRTLPATCFGVASSRPSISKCANLSLADVVFGGALHEATGIHLAFR